MSKKNQVAFRYRRGRSVPKLKTIKTEWDLRRHYYTSGKDRRIEKDVRSAERAYDFFARKYGKKDFTSSASRLKAALTDLEKLSRRPSSRRPSLYFWLRSVIDARDTEALKKASLISDRLTKASNKMLFFSLAVSKIPKQRQRQYLKDDSLSRFHYYLKSSFEDAKHLLTEPEEKILSLKSDVSHNLWVQGTEKVLNKRTVTYKKVTVPLASAMDRVDTLPPKEKPRLWGTITDELKDIAEIAENEVNAVVTNKKISDELRRYEHPYSATIQSYENDETAVLSLVDAISDAGFALSKKYYALKAKALHMKDIPYCNRNDVLGDDIKVPFKTAVELCRETFYSLHNDYGRIFDRMLEEGAIDVYPKKGKSGGAFCLGTTGIPTFVMLNQVDTVRSLSTLAHEMGHAIHTEMSKRQPVLYEGYSTTTAETASTLFEGIVQDKFISLLSEKQKLGALSQKLNESIATIQRQVAFFNFECELHETIRAEGGMTWQEIAKLLQKHMRSYLGPSVAVTEDDGVSFVFVSHFRRFFYVYSYAYGELMSNMMRLRLAEDERFKKNVYTFLSLGGSDTVENIFKKIGINARKTDTFLESLTTLQDDIALFQKLTTKK